MTPDSYKEVLSLINLGKRGYVDVTEVSVTRIFLDQQGYSCKRPCKRTKNPHATYFGVGSPVFEVNIYYMTEYEGEIIECVVDHYVRAASRTACREACKRLWPKAKVNV